MQIFNHILLSYGFGAKRWRPCIDSFSNYVAIIDSFISISRIKMYFYRSGKRIDMVLSLNRSKYLNNVSTYLPIDLFSFTSTFLWLKTLIKRWVKKVIFSELVSRFFNKVTGPACCKGEHCQLFPQKKLPSPPSVLNDGFDRPCLQIHHGRANGGTLRNVFIEDKTRNIVKIWFLLSFPCLLEPSTVMTSTFYETMLSPEARSLCFFSNPIPVRNARTLHSKLIEPSSA